MAACSRRRRSASRPARTRAFVMREASHSAPTQPIRILTYGKTDRICISCLRDLARSPPGFVRRERMGRLDIVQAVLIGMLIFVAGTIPRNLLFNANLRYFAGVPWAV